jgi:hypothetical protein
MNAAFRYSGSLALVLGLTRLVSGGKDPAAASGACDLITRAEAATALGSAVPVGAEKAMSLPLEGHTIPAKYCFYGSEVIIARMELGSGAPALFAKYRHSLTTQDDYATLTGVGDEAFVAKGQVAVRKGNTGLIIDVGQARGGGAKEVAAEKHLAGLAVGRL